MSLTRALPLPYALRHACHGSDGERMVVVGGMDDLNGLNRKGSQKVLLLPGVQS